MQLTDLPLAALHDDELLLRRGPGEHNLSVVPQNVVQLLGGHVLQVTAMYDTGLGISRSRVRGGTKVTVHSPALQKGNQDPEDAPPLESWSHSVFTDCHAGRHTQGSQPPVAGLLAAFLPPTPSDRQKKDTLLEIAELRKKKLSYCLLFNVYVHACAYVHARVCVCV